MMNLKEYFHEEILNECSKEDLIIIVKSLFDRLEFDQTLLHEQIINIRWFRESLKEERNKISWKENYWKDRIKALEVELAVAKKISKSKKETVN